MALQVATRSKLLGTHRSQNSAEDDAFCYLEEQVPLSVLVLICGFLSGRLEDRLASGHDTGPIDHSEVISTPLLAFDAVAELKSDSDKH